MKPGIKTTEFWVTAGSQIIALGILFGVVTPEHLDVANNYILKIGAFVQSTVTAFGYAISRGMTKKGEEK